MDILALEPFHGGVRRAMLDAISRCSRHRWGLLKLPPRRLERRQMVAATWFAEHLSRNGIGKVDLIFASEALNLADFLRLRPELAKRPSVVYFHETQLPDPAYELPESPTDLVNLNSAMAATEIWFNSLYNLRRFLSRASAMVARHPELQAKDPMRSLAAKAHLVPPPIDLAALHDARFGDGAAERDSRAILIDARETDHALLALVLADLARRREEMIVTTIGRLPAAATARLPWPITVVGERDNAGMVRTLLASSIFLSVRAGAASDDVAVRALSVGCNVVVRRDGVYPEIVPAPLHGRCLHDGTMDSIVDCLLDAIYMKRVDGLDYLIDEMLAGFDAMHACRRIDGRLEGLAGVPNVGTRPASTTTAIRGGRRSRRTVGV